MTDFPIPNKLHYEIIPSPGTQLQDWESMKAKLEILKPFAKSVHLDLLDGKFADNKNFMDPAPFKEFADVFTLEAHFMTDDPAQYIESFAASGFKRFIGHIEKMPDIADFVARAERLGEVGLAVDSPTDVEKIFPYLEDIDVAFIMTVKAGFSRQSFLPDCLEKVATLRDKDSLLPIEIDGGVNDTTILQSRDKGATRFVSTGFIFDSPDPKTAYEKLLSLAETT